MVLRLKWGLGLFGTFLILGLNALVGYDLIRDFRASLVTAEDRTQGLTRLLERQASDSFAGVSKVLAGVAEVLAIRDDSWQRGDPDVMALLRRQRDLSPLTRAILIVSADGRLIHDTETGQPADLDLSDRDYLIAHRYGERSGIHLGIPVRGRTSNTWFVSVSRRLVTRDGRFAGVIVAIVEPDALRGFYETLRLGYDAVITLYHADGPIIARYPNHAGFIGKSAVNLPLFTSLLKEGRAGVETFDVAGDGPQRVFAYRASSEVPLVVTVSESRDAVLAPWREKAMATAVLTLAGNGMLGFLSFLLIREVGRRERLLGSLQTNERALRDSQSRLIEDIAARHRAEAELLASKQASDAANRAKTQFLANMSHELRTPLNAVIGFAEALESGIFGTMSPKQTEYVSDIRRSGLHLLSLINDILDTTKVESGKYVLHEEVLPVAGIAGQCLRQIEPAAREKDLVISSSIPADLPPVYTDERALRQILLNLLSNAVKFTPPGGRISLSAVVDGTGLRLCVADSGIGISPEDLDRVMEPFHQVDNSHTRRYPGTGLGLPLVKSLVDMQDGTFTLSSSPGSGTVATVIFPPGRLRPGTPPANPTANPAAEAAGASTRARISAA